MKLNIRVITKASTKPADSHCPWIMDVPPENAGK